MQIINGGNLDFLKITDQPALQIKQGDVSPLLIKKRLGSQEALAVIKGRDVQVQFEGKMPAGDRVSVIIGTVNEKGILVVRPVSNLPAPKTNGTDSLKVMMNNAGFPPEANGDLLTAARLVAANGGAVNEEIITNLQYFLSTESGTTPQKLETVKMLLQKKLELSISQLKAIHQTLHGKNTAETLTGLLDSLGVNVNFAAEQTPKSGNEPDIKAIQQALEGNGDLSEAVEKWLNSMEHNPTEADENNVPLLKNSPSASAAADLYAVSDSLQSQALQTKNVIVTEITIKLAKLAADFKKEQREISSHLEQIARSADSKHNPAAIKQTIENTIHKLDQILLKSDFMLYADMETEKKMLTASSRLAEARELIEKGSISEAKAIVKEIKASIDNILFKPANVKMQHFAAEQSLLKKETDPSQVVSRQIQQALNPIQGQEPSGRQVFESMKALGLTHEIDAAQALLKPKLDQQEQQANLKSALMKLLQNEEGQTPKVQAIEQTLSHITGQQLLNKSEASGLQQLYMQLPLLLNKRMENIKVYVSSEKKGEELDWENCSLYFVLETKRMGEVGIMVNAQNRQLSLTFKNDQALFKEKMEPLAGEALDRLKEIGYNTGAIQYQSFTNGTSAKEEQPNATRKGSPEAAQTEKGFDFSI